MRRFGLIGFPLSHSFSANYFSNKFKELEITDCSYELYPLNEIEHVKLLFHSYDDLEGLNVTIPYKESIIPYLDDLDEAAKKIGAVNCIKITSGIKTGYNTDHFGFTESLKNISAINKIAIVLGNGGASKAIQYGLSQMDFKTILVSRKPEKNQLSYADLTEEIIASAGIIINTTPLGMYPEINAQPNIPYSAMHKNQLAYDLIYNPTTTKFMETASSYGAQIMNGMEMLKLQAEESWRIWNA
ncbi:MAG: shikimate dehydrogenase [Chitinophagales bacterium]